MENHPIPQDVTGFKFKLIGSVTVKQFLYLVAGGILAAVFFMLPFPGIIKYPLAFICGGIGAALAFIPIEGRPMDVMLKNFLKALPSENQYIFKKRGAEALISEFFTPQSVTSIKVEQTKTQEDTALEAKRALLYKTLRQSYKPDDKEQAVLSTITSYLNEANYSASPPIQNIDNQPTQQPSSLVQIVTPSTTLHPIMDTAQAIKIVTPSPLPKETPMQKPTPQIQIVEAPQPLPQPVFADMKPIEPPAIPTPPMQENPLSQVSTPLTSTSAAPSLVGVSPDQSTQVTSVTPSASLKAGFPELPDTPNIVMGIIKDPRGKVIPNILVEIMDPQGIPVRAFKTNALGQFAAATPLPNGEYNVLLEDPRKLNEFEQIHISLSGEIFQPLEIISVDQREKLRRELFGGGQAPAPTLAQAGA